MGVIQTTAQRVAAPDRLTIPTCIGCGAMSLPARCEGGCGPERKLELVAASELDALIDLEQASRARAQALRSVLSRFLAAPDGPPPDGSPALARAALRRHGREWAAASRALEAEVEPVVAWWCERCGGLDAPAPCLGVCLRRSAQWASLDALRRRREVAARRLEDEQRLAGAVRALALTHPRPGREAQHAEALAELAGRALLGG